MWISKKKYDHIMMRLEALEIETNIVVARHPGYSPKEAVEALYKHFNLTLYRTFPDIKIKEKV